MLTRPTVFAAMAAAACVFVSLLLLVVETYTGLSCEFALETGVQTCTHTSATLLEENGNGVLLVLAIPVAAALLVLWAVATRHKHLAWLGAGTIAIFTFVTGFSIGLYYIPTAVLACSSAFMLLRDTPPEPTQT